MKIRLDQLPKQLQQTHAPVYLISGDEPVLVQQAVTTLRHALQPDPVEYEKIHINQGNWAPFEAAYSNQSLFSTEKLIHLILPTDKIGTIGSKTLTHYLQQPATGVHLLITAPKLSTATAKWVKVIEAAGVHIAIWPLNRSQTMTWLRQTMQRYDLKLELTALELLFDATEGNLLAAQQELEKLHLHYGPTQVSTTQVATAISQQHQFNLFELTDTMLTGDAKRISKIMHTLQQEQVAPSFLLWAITRDLRMLATISVKKQSTSIAELLRTYRIPTQRKHLVQQVIQRHSTHYLHQLLTAAYHIDTMIKGARSGNIWQQLMQLTLALSPSSPFPLVGES